MNIDIHPLDIIHPGTPLYIDNVLIHTTTKPILQQSLLFDFRQKLGARYQTMDINHETFSINAIYFMSKEKYLLKQTLEDMNL